MSIDPQYIGGVLLRTVGCLLAFGLCAFAQAEEPKMVVNLGGLRDSPIANHARIQGDVVFKVSANGPELVSSANPLLAPAAADNLKTWTLPPRSGGYRVTYHIQVLDAGQYAVPIGSKLGRFFRRLAGARTEWTLPRCYNWGADPDPAPRFAVTDGAEVSVDVFAEFLPRCSSVD